MRALADTNGVEDAVVVNTCAGTAEAVRKARKEIRRLRRDNPQARMIVTGCAAQTNPESFAAINRMMTEMDLTPLYSKITCPSLVIGCAYDSIRPPQEVEAISRQIPGAEYVVAESGHFMPHQTPELFVEMALPFLLA